MKMTLTFTLDEARTSLQEFYYDSRFGSPEIVIHTPVSEQPSASYRELFINVLTKQHKNIMSEMQCWSYRADNKIQNIKNFRQLMDDIGLKAGLHYSKLLIEQVMLCSQLGVWAREAHLPLRLTYMDQNNQPTWSDLIV